MFCRIDIAFFQAVKQSFIQSPKIIAKNFQKGLVDYPDSSVAREVINAVSFGFRVYFHGDVGKLPKKKYNHPVDEVGKLAITEDLTKELRLGHIVPTNTVPHFVCPLGVVPKDVTKWRVIRDASHGKENSLNAGIPEFAKVVSYPTFREVCLLVAKSGKNGYLFKIDLKSAYRQLPIHKDDWLLLGYYWKGVYLIDTRMPFGISSACRSAQNFGKCIVFIAEKYFIPKRLHNRIRNYIDDFFGGAPTFDDCKLLYDGVMKACKWLGVVVGLKKCFSPRKELIILGWKYNTVHMTVGLELTKKLKFELLIDNILKRNTAKRSEIESLVGKLQWSATVVWPGIAFLRRLRDSYLKPQSIPKHFHVNLNKGIKSDLAWWKIFIKSIDTVSIKRIIEPPIGAFVVATDASSTGLGGFCFPDWFYYDFPLKIDSDLICYYELLAVAMAFKLYAFKWKNCVVKLFVDNIPVCNALIKKNTNINNGMNLVRFICMQCVKYRIQYFANYIRTADNDLADLLSRQKPDMFKFLCRGTNFSINPKPKILKPFDFVFKY